MPREYSLPAHEAPFAYNLFMNLNRFFASVEFGYPDSNTPQTFVTDQVTATGPPFNPGPHQIIVSTHVYLPDIFI